MSIVGVTIDYGPYGFLDYYDPNYLSQASGEWQLVTETQSNLYSSTMVMFSYPEYLITQILLL